MGAGWSFAGLGTWCIPILLEKSEWSLAKSLHLDKESFNLMKTTVA